MFNPEYALEMHIPPKGLTKSLRINDLSGLNPDIENHHFGSQQIAYKLLIFNRQIMH